MRFGNGRGIRNSMHRSGFKLSKAEGLFKEREDQRFCASGKLCLVSGGSLAEKAWRNDVPESSPTPDVLLFGRLTAAYLITSSDHFDLQFLHITEFKWVANVDFQNIVYADAFRPCVQES
ncbi:hypothetical protein Q8A67_019892 [Cirrhinus molitorella]|uniref:Uncharacterized protein n=1 Tax=Cirrhinus molitorella TaxID=172907 RepID=A0AA88TGS0_9TELE|nr:hypothetical protein Q8A67_019892 [Cirrhinus molitorella]